MFLLLTINLHFRLKMKQNRYPVLFLTQGVTKRYPPYADPRCHTIQSAVNFSCCQGLLVSFHFIQFSTMMN